MLTIINQLIPNQAALCNMIHNMKELKKLSMTVIS